MTPTTTGNNYIVLIVTCIVGLAMLWAKIAEIAVNRRNKEQVDQTTLATKEIDDDIAWRTALIQENTLLRAELRQANEAINKLLSNILPHFEQLCSDMKARGEEHTQILRDLKQILRAQA